MKKPVIGLVPLVDTGRESLWMLPGYMDGIREAGGLPVMLPLNDDSADVVQMLEICDGILFTGGHDVNPELYGQKNEGLTGELIPARDSMEGKLLKAALKLDKGVLGICRGLQFINVMLGGSLYQDIPTQFESNVNHRQPAPYHLPIHPVTVSGPLAEAVEAEEIMVNSCHHQGIRDLSPELEIMASAPDGLVEAIRLPGKKFVWAVQWHPEFMHRVDENSRRIFRGFVEGCK